MGQFSVQSTQVSQAVGDEIPSPRQFLATVVKKSLFALRRILPNHIHPSHIVSIYLSTQERVLTIHSHWYLL